MVKKLLDSAKKSPTDAIKTAEVADKIISVSKKSPKELHSQNDEIEIPKERYISPEKRQQIIDVLRLVYNNNGISKNNKFARQYVKSTV